MVEKRKPDDPRDRGQIDPPVMYDLPATPAAALADVEQDRLKAHARAAELDRRVKELEEGIRYYVERELVRGRKPLGGSLLMSTEDMRRVRYLLDLAGDELPVQDAIRLP